MNQQWRQCGSELGLVTLATKSQLQVTRLHWTLPGKGMGPSPLLSCKLQINQVATKLCGTSCSTFRTKTAPFFIGQTLKKQWETTVVYCLPGFDLPLAWQSHSALLNSSRTGNVWHRLFPLSCHKSGLPVTERVFLLVRAEETLKLYLEKYSSVKLW